MILLVGEGPPYFLKPFFSLCLLFATLVLVAGFSPVVSGAAHSVWCAGFWLQCTAWAHGLHMCEPQLWSRARERKLSSCGTTGPTAPQPVGPSPAKDRTSVPCIARRSLNHRTTREALDLPTDGIFLQNKLPRSNGFLKCLIFIIDHLRVKKSGLELWTGYHPAPSERKMYSQCYANL